MNPFMHGVAVTGNDFCPRPELVKQLHGHIDAHQNCVLRGVRRVGKTSAVLEAVRTSKRAKHIYVNCWGKLDTSSLASAIYEAFLIYQKRKGISLEKIIRSFAHLRPKVGVDPYSGEPTFTVDMGSGAAQDAGSIDGVFDLLGHESKKCPLVVVFDEFQALLKLKEADALMANMRGAIQLQPRVTYLYLGSARNLMDEIFNSPDKPFYKSAAAISVPPIARNIYKPYIEKKFASGRRSIELGALAAIFDAAQNITGDVQQLCSELWNCTDPGDPIRTETVPHGLERIHRAEHESNSRIIDLLTPGQVRVLSGLALVGGGSPTSHEFLTAAGVPQPSSVTRALNMLTKRGLVYRSAEEYRFFSPFFRTWLLTQNI